MLAASNYRDEEDDMVTKEICSEKIIWRLVCTGNNQNPISEARLMMTEMNDGEVIRR